MILTYVIMLGLFFGPIAVTQFLRPFTTLTDAEIGQYTVTSPFSAIFSVPLQFRDTNAPSHIVAKSTGGGFPVDWCYLGFALGGSVVLLILMDILFRLRWRAAAQ